MSVSFRIAGAAVLLVLGLGVAGAAFAGPSASIEQVRNGVATAPTTPVPNWGTGNAGASNSHYLESHSTAYRAVMDGLPTDGTVIELIIGYDVKRSGSYAIDYLTQYQRLLPHVLFGHSQPEVFDPLNGVTGVGPVITTAPIPVPTRNLVVDPDGSDPEPAASQPSTNMLSLPAAEKVMTLFGGTLVDVTYVTEGDVSLGVKSSETRVRVRFTANGPKAVLAWGGHIACRWDWGFNADGTPRSAGGISGSSYHMRLVTWNLGSLGSQDRSMSTDAVYPVPRCGISNLGPFCAGTTNTHTAPIGMESYQWTLADNTAGAEIVGSATGTSVTVHTGTAGSYRVLVSTGASGFTKECDGTVTVAAPPSADAGADQAVCASAPQVQLAGVVSGGSSLWTGGAGSFSPSASAANAIYTPSAAEITAGGVTLTLTSSAAGGPCAPASDQVRITIQRAATANAGADQILCATNPLVQLAGLVGGSATGGTWSGGVGSFSPSASALNATYLPTPDEVAAGSVTLTLTSVGPGGPCPAVSDAMKITINPAATADAGADQTVCATSPQVLLAGAIGGGASTGTWSGGAGTYSPNASTPTATYTPSAAEITAGGVTLTFTSNDPAGPCVAASDQMRITINRAATVNAGIDQIVCSSNPQVQLAGVFGGGASSGSWSGGSGSFNPDPSSPNATYVPSAAEIAAGSVTLTFTTDDPAGPCAAVSDQMKITINPAATADAGADQAVCSTSPQVLLAGAIGGGASSGTWSGGTGTYSPSASSLNATYTPSAAEIAAGGVTLTLTSNDPAGPCAAANDQVRITINPAASANAGLDQTVCSSNPQVQLAASFGGGASSGSWSGGAGTFSPDANSPAATYTPSAAEIAAGSVTLTFTSDDPTGPCGAVSDQMRITISPAATVNAGADRAVCSTGPQVQLAGVFGGGAASATWSGGAGSFSPNASSPTATYTPSAAEIAAGAVTLTFTTNDPAGPCGAVSDQMMITISPAATVAAGADQTVCASSPQVQLVGAFGGGASSGSWSGGNGSFSPGASSPNAVYTPSAAEIAAGAVTLTFTTNDPAGPCGPLSDQMVITISPAATVNAGADRAVCASSPQVQLAGSVGGSAASGLWSGGSGSFSPNASSPTATYTPSAAEIAAGAVTLTFTTNDPAGPCGAVSDQMMITISPAATVAAGADQAVCASSPQVQLAGAFGGGASSGSWSGGNGSFSPSASSPTATYTPSAAEIAAGSVTLTFTTNDPAGPCGAASDQMVITISPAATVNAGVDQRVCASSPQVQLAGIVGGGASIGTWSGGAGTFSPTPTALNATYTPTAAEIAAGGVTLTLTTNDPNGPCPPVSDQVRITIDPITVVNAGPDQAVCSSSPQVTLNGTVSGTVSTGTWSGGTGTFNPSRSALNAIYTPSAAEIAAGQVTLTLTSAASGGPCPPASDAMTITIGLAGTVNAGPDQVACLISPQVQLAGLIGGSATSATWSGGGGTFSPNATTLNAVYMPSAAEIAARTVTLTLTTNDPTGPCPPVSDQMKITVDAPTVSVTSKTVCSGIMPISVCANASNGIAPYTYLWSNGSTTQCISVFDTLTYTVTVTDARGCQASGSGGMHWRDCTGVLTHTSATCSNFMDGTADDILSADIHYGLQNGCISTISPGVFFYYTLVKAPSVSFTINVVQTKDNPAFPFIPVMQGQISEYDANCTNLASGVETSPGQSSVAVTGATVGKVYVLSIKYSLKDLVGVCMPDTIGAHYDFLTQVNGVTVDKDPDGIQIGKPYGPPPPPPVPTPAPGDTVILIPNVPRHGAVLGATAQAVDLPLYRPMPNPFSDGMHMAYAVGPEGARVRISVYDVSGRRVRSLADGEEAPGSHVVAWDGRDDQGMRMRGGVYFVHAQVGREVKQVRVMFLK